MSQPSFTTKLVAPPQSVPVILTDDVLRSRCAAAARMAMRGDGYSTEDRADCAAKVLGAVISGRTAFHGSARDVLRYLDWTDRYPATVRAMSADDLLAVPASAATFSRLVGMAANIRRTLDRDRARDRQDAARRTADDGFTPHLEDADPTTRNSPHGARRVAVDMLRNLGMLDGGGDPDRRTWDIAPIHAHGSARDVLRYIDRCASILNGRAWPVAWGDFLRDTPRLKSAARADSPHGPTWSAAYAAARAAAGLDAKEIAEELGIGYGTLRNHLSDAAAAIPSTAVYGPADHCSALGMEEPVARKAAGTRTHSADLDHRDRVRPDVIAPVTVRTVTPRQTATPPAWTVGLSAATAGRYEYAAKVRRARSAAKTEAQRRTDRAAAGLPGAVL